MDLNTELPKVTGISERISQTKERFHRFDAMEALTNLQQSNAVVREKYTEVNPQCTLKVIVAPRVFGTRGSQGSSLAKSAIRLGIDTKVISEVSFEKSSLRGSSKTEVHSFRLSSESAVKVMDMFENRFGGKMSDSIRTKAEAYQKQKTKLITELKIAVGNNGRPLFSSDEQSKTYFNQLKDFSYTGVEIYISVKPDGVRATRTRSCRVLDGGQSQVIEAMTTAISAHGGTVYQEI